MPVPGKVSCDCTRIVSNTDACLLPCSWRQLVIAATFIERYNIQMWTTYEKLHIREVKSSKSIFHCCQMCLIFEVTFVKTALYLEKRKPNVG